MRTIVTFLFFITTCCTTIYAQCGIDISFTPQNVSCQGESTGSVMTDITITDSTLYAPPLSYQWSNGDSTLNLDSIYAGVYGLQITDTNGCITTEYVTVSQPFTTVQGVIYITQFATYLNDPYASITAFGNGGTQPYTYEWYCKPPSIPYWPCYIDTPQTTQTIYDDFGLLYKADVIITDANGCTVEVGITSFTECNICLTADVTHVYCQEDSTGQIVLNMPQGCGFFGGCPPYTILWSDGDTSTTRSNLPAGTYNCTVTSSDGDHIYPQIVVEHIYDSVTVQNPDIVACDSAQINANWYYTSQMIRDTFQTNKGCDSIINTNLTIHYSQFQQQNIEACDSVFILGEWHHTSTSLFDTLATSNACDSLVEYLVTINQSESNLIIDTIQNGDIYTLPSGITAQQAGLYYDTLLTFYNCDSIITTNLFVDSATSINNINEILAWSIYPNPAKDQITIKIEGLANSFEAEIVNTLGQIIHREILSLGNNSVTTQNWPNGIYIVIISSKNGLSTESKKISVVHY